MLVRLFMIPWSLYIVRAQNNLNNIPNSNALVTPQFYEFLQRQNQFNNALLLHNTLLHNSMAANLRENQLNNGLFVGQAPLVPMPIPTIDHNTASGTAQFPTPILNHQGGNAFTPEDHLGIYETLYPMSADRRVASSVQTNRQGGVTSFIPKSALSESQEEETNAKQNNTKKLLEASPEVHMKIKQIVRSSKRPTTMRPPTTNNLPSRSTEAPPAIPDVVRLLKQLNLTETEQTQLIYHVEQVVREELAKKLIETKLSSFTLAPRKTTTDMPPEPQTTTVVFEIPTLPPTTIPKSAEFIQSTEKKLINIEQNEMAKIQNEKSSETRENTIKPEELEIKLREEIRLSTTIGKQEQNTKDLPASAIKTSERHIAIEERGVENEEDTLEELVPFTASGAHNRVTRPPVIKEPPSKRVTPRLPIHRPTQKTTSRPSISTTTEVPASTTDDFVPELPGDLITEETTQVESRTTYEAEETTSRPPEEEMDPNKAVVIPRRSFLESDNDLLDVATGAPLDLNVESKNEEVAYRIRHSNMPSESQKSVGELMTAQNHANGPQRPTRPQTHSPTDFEKLALDYRERLSGTGDINKILKSLYQNAYIQLVENTDANKKIRKPQEPKRSEARYG